MLFAGTSELIPLYALYALLFADHGLDTGQISVLLATWSATAFLLEVPSGGWADTVSRRKLLVLSGVLLTVGFALWTALPSFVGFAAGFVLWGASGALRSGTFEALLYDELVAHHAATSYPRILGYTRAAAEIGAAGAVLGATPLYLVGGYDLVGWVSVAAGLAHTALALALPVAPKVVSNSQTDAVEGEVTGHGAEVRTGSADVPASPEAVESGRSLARYLAMLRIGLAESTRMPRVRGGVALGAFLGGITAVDEYFGLVAAQGGAATSVVPVLIGMTVFGSSVGSILAGRTEAVSARTLAVALGCAGVLLFAGSVAVGLAVRWPAEMVVLIGIGFGAIAVSYGIVCNAGDVAAARLQATIDGPARATVTSVSGLLQEVVSLAVFGFVALATVWLSMSTTIALLGVAVLGIAVLAPQWLPSRRAESVPVADVAS